MSNLNGKWLNQLGSYMELVVDSTGGITGIYNTGVGNASGDYILVGRTDIIGNATSGNVGFVVSWNNSANGNSDSVTAWAGQLQILNGVPTITTTWLLTDETNPTNNLKSTIIGKGTFRTVLASQSFDPLEQSPHPKAL